MTLRYEAASGCYLGERLSVPGPAMWAALAALQRLGVAPDVALDLLANEAVWEDGAAGLRALSPVRPARPGPHPRRATRPHRR